MSSGQFLELRIYKVHYGRRDKFAESMETVLLPLFRRQGINVIHHGPSAHDKESYLLIRAFSSVADRTQKLDAAFSNADWLMNYETDIMSMIELTGTAVIPADELMDVLVPRFGAATELSQRAD